MVAVTIYVTVTNVAGLLFGPPAHNKGHGDLY